MSDAATTADQAAEKPADATPVTRLASRDGAIAIAGLSLFGAADAWQATSGLGLAALVAVLNGVVVGIVLGTLAHEWGHFAGARLSGGIAPTRGYGSFFPIFDFDMVNNDDASFRAMSVGGNVAHWAFFLLLFVVLPLDTAGRAALVAAAFGVAVADSTTELPIIRKAYGGASPIESFAGFSGAKLKRDRWIGAAAGLVLFLML